MVEELVSSSSVALEQHLLLSLHLLSVTRVVYETLKPQLAVYLETERQAREAKRQERRGHSCAQSARLSEATLKKAAVFARIRSLAHTGITSFEELVGLFDDIASDEALAGDASLSRLLATLSQALADGVVTVDEQTRILAECWKLADPVVRDLRFPVDFASRSFVLTGEFERGRDNEIQNYIAQAGGEAHKRTPSNRDHYVVVGNNGSRHWAFGDYGMKVEKAIAMQADGKEIFVISEDVLFSSLSRIVVPCRQPQGATKKCPYCFGSSFLKQGDYLICEYCGTSFLVSD